VRSLRFLLCLSLLCPVSSRAADAVRLPVRVVVSASAPLTSRVALRDAGAELVVRADAAVLSRPVSMAKVVRNASGLALAWPPTSRMLDTLERLDVARCRLLVDVSAPSPADRSLAARLGPCAVTWTVPFADAAWISRVPAPNARVRLVLPAAPDGTSLAALVKQRLTLLVPPGELRVADAVRSSLAAHWSLGAWVDGKTADDATLRTLEHTPGLTLVVVDGAAPALPARWLSLPGEREWRLPADADTALLARARDAVLQSGRPGAFGPTERELDAPLGKLPAP